MTTSQRIQYGGNAKQRRPGACHAAQ